MARTYKRDARGRFAGGGYSGQTGGRGARLKSAGSKRAGGGAKAKAVKRATPGGAIRSTDVRKAKISNAISKNIERRNKAGLNPPTAARENQGARVARATREIAARTGQAPNAATGRSPKRAAVPKTYSKVDRSVGAISRRRSRALAERSSISPGSGFSMARTTRSMITRSAANAIYNRQRATAKALGKNGKVADGVLRDGIGVVKGLSGSKRNRADQLREAARKRVIAGRRGRR